MSECSEAEREIKWTHEQYVETLQQFIVYPPEREKEYLECLLFSEIGEVVGVHAKYVRGDFDEAEYKRRLIGELGDVLFAASLLYGKITTDHPRFHGKDGFFKAACQLCYALYESKSCEYKAYLVGRRMKQWLSIPGITIEELREANVAKLKSRMERGKIKGDGDER